MHEGQLIIIAGRPAMGKTAFALNIALHVGSNQGLPVGVFSLEMSAEEVTGRLLSAKGEIPQGESKPVTWKTGAVFTTRLNPSRKPRSLSTTLPVFPF